MQLAWKRTCAPLAFVEQDFLFNDCCNGNGSPYQQLQLVLRSSWEFSQQQTQINKVAAGEPSILSKLRSSNSGKRLASLLFRWTLAFSLNWGNKAEDVQTWASLACTRPTEVAPRCGRAHVQMPGPQGNGLPGFQNGLHGTTKTLTLDDYCNKYNPLWLVGTGSASLIRKQPIDGVKHFQITKINKKSGCKQLICNESTIGDI